MTFERWVIVVLLTAILGLLGGFFYLVSRPSPPTLDPAVQLCRIVK